MKDISTYKDSFNKSFTDIAEAALWQLPNFVILKDLQSTFLGCNKNFLELAGYKDLDSIIGIKDEELKCEAADYAAVFRQQDKEAMLNKNQVILDIHRFADEKVWSCISQKTALKDKTGKVIGCINQMSEIQISLMTKLGIMVIKENSRISGEKSNSLTLLQDGHEALKITNRELECLFYILRGKTFKQIAKILNLSHRTVESHVDKLKHKFLCRTKSELVEKAIMQGLHATVPFNILSSGLSEDIY